MDHDLMSIQEARDLAVAARAAQKQFLHASQADVDRICAAMAEAAHAAAERLGRMATEETGFGVPQHKTLKNVLASSILWDSIKDVPTVGVVGCDPGKKTRDIAWPMGVVAGVTPSTNPTSTVMFKILIAVKARNGIVIAPHPSAVKCGLETTRIMAEAGERAGMPKGLIACMSRVSLPGTRELMKHRDIDLIVATGGSQMVLAAHSVGKPAYGVGPGNVPVYVDRSADLARAARYVVASKAFDHSTICATEQAVVADAPIAGQLEKLMASEGAYFLDDEQAGRIAKLLFSPGPLINAGTVGKSPQQLARMCGIDVPSGARILVAKLRSVGRAEPLSAEKLTTVLGWYEADGWKAGCERCIELIEHGGRGHSLVVHAEDEEVVMRFGLEKSIFRIIVNSLGSLGATGMTTGVLPSLTLSPGGVGGAITGDNINVHHMFNLKRVAYELNPPPPAAMQPGQAEPAQTAAGSGKPAAGEPARIDAGQVEEIVQRVLAALKK
ncbi:MAG: aldehyde dehydrogenase family protein [Desulfobacteraceae bacterium]|nr:aldehyde dehydrogenase family protein [Desulfobacteraceae bacterium]